MTTSSLIPNKYGDCWGAGVVGSVSLLVNPLAAVLSSVVVIIVGITVEVVMMGLRGLCGLLLLDG